MYTRSMTKTIVTLPAEGDARYEIVDSRPGEVKVRSLKWKSSKWVAADYPQPVND